MKVYCVIFDELAAESGRIAKENILKKYEDVPGFKDILKFAFNPMIKTGLAKRKIQKETSIKPAIDIETIFEAMSFVKDNNTGSDLVIATIQNFLEKLSSDEERELAIRILTKDMPYGISKVTLNKVYGKGFIEKYSVMLAGKYIPGKSDISKGFTVTLKLDGNRMTVFNFPEGPKFMARSGKEIEGLVELEEEFKKLPKNMVYDGEVISENSDSIQSKDLFNETQTIVRKKGKKVGLEFIMFDQLPIKEFEEGKSKLTYKYRLEQMEELFSSIPKDSKIKLVRVYYKGNNESVIPELLSKVEASGLEGLMINTNDGYYEPTRSKSILKVKTFFTADLRCLEILEEVRGGKCGAIVVDYKGHKVRCAILSHKEQKMFWEDPSSVVGKIVEIKYFEESTNQLGTLSLRFPSFLRVREDKDEVSMA